MKNIGLIIAREYLSRVRKKSFIIMSLLGPLLIGGLMFFILWSTTGGVETKRILILDDSKKFGEIFIDSDDAQYIYSDISLDKGKQEVLTGLYDGMLYIPDIDIRDPEGILFYAPNNPSISLVMSLRKKIEQKTEMLKLEASGLDKDFLDNLEADVSITTINLLDAETEQESSSFAATAIGYIASFLIYIFIFVYGAMCMRGVVEEKTSRIIEVIISSVRPFQLMMGKVIGIAGVGLTQFILWIILTFGIISVGTGLLAGSALLDQKKQLEQPGFESPAADEAIQESLLTDINLALASVDVPLVIISFLFFFLSGYLLYGALFAAIGSAVDSDADAQQFMLPVTVPLIASIIMLSVVLNDPNGSLAFWMSMIPLSSPVVMMMRVPFGVPAWQLGLSMLLMIMGFIFTIWIASRIYRVGILMHGAKVNYKILVKWFLSKN